MGTKARCWYPSQCRGDPQTSAEPFSTGVPVATGYTRTEAQTGMSRPITQATLAVVAILAAVVAARVVPILSRAEDPRLPIARVAAVRAPLLVDSHKPRVRFAYGRLMQPPWPV
jgi:hypothetical protein